MNENMLEVKDLEVAYGSIRALKGISFDVKKGEIISLIGANGAGKTTNPDKIVKAGLIHVPEGRRVFANLTVKENLEMGAYLRNDTAGIKADLEHVYELFPRLRERAKQLAGTLSGGEQQMLAMGRGLMSKPELLLLDEPSMGLAPILVDEIFDIIQKINKDGTTILLVEQNAFKAMSIANRVYILETGEVSASGDSQTMIHDESVKKAYLGG